MTRVWCAAAVFCLMATLASAQDGLRSASLPERPLPPMPSARPDLFLATPDTYVPHPPGSRDRGRRRSDGFVYGPGVYGPWLGSDRSGYSARRFERQAATGYLQLQVAPASAEVFIDGLYVGSVNDVRQTIPGYPVDSGPHRLDLRAPGYQTRSVDVRIDPGDTRVYRRDLDPVTPSEPAASRSIALGRPKTFYVIAGCYAGDKPPQASRLPPGCRISNTRRIPPVSGN